ncbi:MAG TPA: flagellar hook-basal body complex protein FliE [Stellaceae bacterium]|nr:flagellar hook-basal body complex protein FliE [Stellaceae bacterium]
MTTVNVMDAVNAYANAGRMAEAGGTGASSGAGSSFGDLVRNAANGVVDTIAKGEQASLQAAAGKADLTQVTEAVSNAQVAVQTVVAVRDRVVQAYQDIMRMPI